MQRILAKKRTNRSGAVVLEFILVAPLVFIAFLALFEFGLVALTLQVGHAALIEGTRRGAELYPPDYPLVLDNNLPDNDIADQVVEIMNGFLNIHKIEIYDPTQGPGVVDDPNFANAQIIIERNEQTITRGTNVVFPTGYTCTPSGDSPTPNEIRVTLCFPIVYKINPAADGRPVPDWLSPVGFTLADCVFQDSARMPLEMPLE